MNWYLKVLRQYVDFKGRARRKEYWMFSLIHAIIILGIGMLGAMDMLLFVFGSGPEPYEYSVTSYIFLLYFFATFIPNIAVTVRRLHDIGKSGWWVVILFVPYISMIGTFVILIFTVMDSEAETNKWGPNPKKKVDDDEINLIGTE